MIGWITLLRSKLLIDFKYCVTPLVRGTDVYIDMSGVRKFDDYDDTVKYCNELGFAEVHKDFYYNCIYCDITKHARLV